MVGQIGKKIGFLAVVVVAAVIGGATTAIVGAAIPSTTDGQISACYRNNGGLTSQKGSLRVIDKQAGESCTGQESSLAWSQGKQETKIAYAYINPDGTTIDNATRFNITDYTYLPAGQIYNVERGGETSAAACFNVAFKPIYAQNVIINDTPDNVDYVNNVYCGPGYNAVRVDPPANLPIAVFGIAQH